MLPDGREELEVCLARCARRNLLALEHKDKIPVRFRPKPQAAPLGLELVHMRSQPNPHCDLCGGNGAKVYQNQRNRLFKAPDEWTLKRCLNSSCGLLWLDPMPLPDDLHLAYTSYYTHTTPAHKGSANILRLLLRYLTTGLLGARLPIPTR